MKHLLIDIPFGYSYGFPKQIPDEYVTTIEERLTIDPDKRVEYRAWLTEQNDGKEVEGYCRFITVEDGE